MKYTKIFNERFLVYLVNKGYTDEGYIDDQTLYKILGVMKYIEWRTKLLHRLIEE